MKNNSPFVLAKVSKVLVYLFFLAYLTGKAFADYWLFDIVAQYSVYTLTFTLLSTVVYIYAVRKNQGKSILFPVIFILCFWQLFLLVRPFYFGENAKAETANYKVASINIYSQNEEVESLKNFLDKEKPDLILLQEVTSNWQKKLDFLRAQYPNYHEEVRDNNFGIALYSRYPIDTLEVKNYIDEMHPSLWATILVGGKKLQVLGTHPVPPLPNQARFEKRNLQYELMKKEIEETKQENIVLVGDLNSTVFSPNINKIKNHKLKDARLGFGFQNSWNAFIPIFRTNIDHIWVSKNIKVTNFYRGDFIESDHFPIIAELKIE